MEKINEIFKKYALVRDQETLDPNSDPLFKITLGDDYAYLKTCVNLFIRCVGRIGTINGRSRKI